VTNETGLHRGDEQLVRDLVRVAADRVDVAPPDLARIIGRQRRTRRRRRAVGTVSGLAAAAVVAVVLAASPWDGDQRIDAGPPPSEGTAAAPPDVPDVSTLGATTVVPRTPDAPALACEPGGQGRVRMTPPMSDVAGPVTLDLVAPTTPVTCESSADPTATGVQMDQLSLRYESVSCADYASGVATGTARLRWSDGATSDATVTLRGAATEIVVTTGRFAGLTGTSTVVASNPCDDGATDFAITVGALLIEG
jgi:hypothetical protein